MALFLVGIFILFQTGALFSVFFLRHAVVEIESKGPTSSLSSTRLPTDDVQDELKVSDINNFSADQNSLTSSEFVTHETPSQVDELNNQARAYRRDSEFLLAEEKLLQALAIDANHTATLINLAMLQEAMGKEPQALEYWRILMGTSQDESSPLHRLATTRIQVLEEKLRKQEFAVNTTEETLPLPQKVIIDRIVFRPNPLPNNPTTMEFEFMLRAKQAPIDSSKMRIQVFFYDRLAEHDLVPAKIQARFLNQQPRWSLETSETLRVNYQRSAVSEPQRTYFGYLIRIIYEDEVQDERAEPATLLRLFPFPAKPST